MKQNDMIVKVILFSYWQHGSGNKGYKSQQVLDELALLLLRTFLVMTAP